MTEDDDAGSDSDSGAPDESSPHQHSTSLNPSEYDDGIDDDGDLDDAFAMIANSGEAPALETGFRSITIEESEGEESTPIRSVRHEHIDIVCGSWVKLVPDDEGIVDYFRILEICKTTTTQEITLRGLRIKAIKSINGMLPKTSGDVTIVVDIVHGDNRPIHEQAIQEIRSVRWETKPSNSS